MVFIDPTSVARLDAALCTEDGFDICELMGRAGDAVAADARAMLLERGCAEGDLLLLCGPGNNGGDAFAAGVKLIRDFGYRVSAIELVGFGEAREHFRGAFIAAGGAVYDESRLDGRTLAALVSRSELIIDGIFGAGGGGRALPESVVRLTGAISDRCVLAIDLPTGVCGSSGEVVEGAVRADAVTMLCAAKPGLYSYPARAFCGEIFFHGIGVSDSFILERFPEIAVASSDERVAPLIPSRAPDSHKGSFGRALLVCGSARYRGAAALSVAGALRCGAGIVCIASEERVVSGVIAHRPEAIAEIIPPISELDDVGRESLCELSDGYSAILVGCGSGKSSSLRRLVYRLLRRAGGPLVLDADAINSLAEEREESLSRLSRARREVLLTPHPTEFSRLIGVPIAEVQASRMRHASEFATKYKVNLILKGAASVIASPDGRVTVNTSGSPALAHGGTGDVLAGACVSFSVQGVPLFDAAVLAAHLHGRAGELASEEFSDGGVLAGDLPEAMARVMRRLTEKK